MNPAPVLKLMLSEKTQTNFNFEYYLNKNNHQTPEAIKWLSELDSDMLAIKYKDNCGDFTVHMSNDGIDDDRMLFSIIENKKIGFQAVYVVKRVDSSFELKLVHFEGNEVDSFDKFKQRLSKDYIHYVLTALNHHLREMDKYNKKPYLVERRVTKVKGVTRKKPKNTSLKVMFNRGIPGDHKVVRAL